MPVSRREARELMSLGYELGAAVLTGALQREADGSWRIGDQALEDVLAAWEGQEVVLVADALGAAAGPTQICRVCGTEYQGHACPRCREVRKRLRG
jgi:rubrerythrin